MMDVLAYRCGHMDITSNCVAELAERRDLRQHLKIFKDREILNYATRMISHNG